MLPPADESVLQSNPDFANVYRALTESLLHPDGSSVDHTCDQNRAAIREELKAHRFEATKHQIIKQALVQITPVPDADTTSTKPSSKPPPGGVNPRKKPTKPSSSPDSTLPPDLLSLLTLLPAFLNTAHTLSPSSLTSLLSNPPFTTSLPSQLPLLTTLLSQNLTSSASQLAKTVYPTTNPSFIHRHIPNLPTTTLLLTSRLLDSQQQLSTSRVRAAHDLLSHLNLHTAVLTEILLPALESKHGIATTNTTLRAERVAAEAQTWNLAVAALMSDVVNIIYPPEARAALGNYSRHLAQGKMRVLDTARVRVAELEDYGVDVRTLGIEGVEGGRGSRGGGGGGGDENKEKVMREIAKVWKEMEGRMGEVRRDLKRLGRI